MRARPRRTREALRFDAFALVLAGLVNTFLAAATARFVLGPGTTTQQFDALARASWIAEHGVRWQAGWLFWFVVTLSFAWSFFALGRNLGSVRPWPGLAVGVALVAAAVDLVGVLVNVAVVPHLARAVVEAGVGPPSDLVVVFRSAERFAYGATNVAGFGLYTVAGILLLPAVFGTSGFPRWLAAVGVAEWTVAGVATALLAVAPDTATGPLIVSFVLYAPWVWGCAAWLWRESMDAPASGTRGQVVPGEGLEPSRPVGGNGF